MKPERPDRRAQTRLDAWTRPDGQQDPTITAAAASAGAITPLITEYLTLKFATIDNGFETPSRHAAFTMPAEPTPPKALQRDNEGPLYLGIIALCGHCHLALHSQSAVAGSRGSRTPGIDFNTDIGRRGSVIGRLRAEGWQA